MLDWSERWEALARSSDALRLDDRLEAVAAGFPRNAPPVGGDAQPWPEGHLDKMTPHEIRRIMVDGVPFDIMWLPGEEPWRRPNDKTPTSETAEP